jgi:hypothetical protein
LRFIHIGEVVEEVLPELQRQPFFLRFTGYLREQCSIGPDVTRLDRVASADGNVTTYPRRPSDRN